MSRPAHPESQRPTLKGWRHPSTWISLAALFFALTGTGYAAHALIGSRDIADRSIQLRDLSPAAVAGLRGATGPAGSFDPGKITRVVGVEVGVAPGNVGTATVSCPSGQVATGGGGGGGIAGIAASVPLVAPGSTTPGGWAVVVSNQTTITVQAQAYAVCAAP